MQARKRILVLAPHTDDGELGCGGTISRYVREMHEVYYVAFSTAAKSLAPQYPSDQLVTEVKAATKILGVPSENLIIYDYEVRELNFHRQRILEDLVILNNRLRPDWVFTPSLQDIHQDHITVTNEAKRAFKYCSLLGYELPWNNLSMKTDCFISITEGDLSSKIAALKAYETQSAKPYMSSAFIRSLATVRGVQSGTSLAEAFEVIRVMLDKL